uniref:Uncharacterized protein n=1 Tax=Timema genevievae TaxID=629358 RepID=A0A7R9K484_TIMGE|nr:unnamed protein product [Timema genevievae]
MIHFSATLGIEHWTLNSLDRHTTGPSGRHMLAVLGPTFVDRGWSLAGAAGGGNSLSPVTSMALGSLTGAPLNSIASINGLGSETDTQRD